MEAGYRTTGHGNKQDREQRTQAGVVKTGVDRQVHGGMRHQQTQHGTGDHADEHKGGHVIARLFQQPHRQHRREKDVDKGDVDPGFLACDQRHGHAQGQSGHGAYQANRAFLPAGEGKLFLQQAEDHGKHNEQQADGTGRTIHLSGFGQHAGLCVGIEGTGHHVRKGRDDQQGEQPAEQKEQLAAQLADVFLDQQAHGTALVLHTGIQCAEVGDCTEEDAAQQNPKQHRQPAEGCCLDGTGNRAGARNGGKLVAEHGPAVGGNIVFAVFMAYSRCLGLRVNTPGLGQPASVKSIGAHQAHRRNQHDDKRIHDSFSPLLSNVCPRHVRPHSHVVVVVISKFIQLKHECQPAHPFFGETLLVFLLRCTLIVQNDNAFCLYFQHIWFIFP